MHVSGIENVVADALSRPSPEPKSAPEPISVPSASSLAPLLVLFNPVLYSYNFCGLSAHPLTVLSISFRGLRSSPSLSLVSFALGASSLLCDMSSGSLQPLLPPELRQEMFELLLGSSHPGIHASWRLLSAQFVWPGLSRDMGL